MDVPANIQQPHAIVSQVQVLPGRNYDLSRSTPATPVVRVPEAPATPPSAYRPGDPVPAAQPDAVVRFRSNARHTDASVVADLARQLRGRDLAVVVAGHAASSERDAAALAHRRALQLADALTKAGVRARPVAFGATRASGDPAQDARVDLFFTPDPLASYRLLR